MLGAISGFFLGLFVAIDLQQFSVRPLDNLSVIGLPLIGLAIGLGVALWAPLGRKGPKSPAAAVGPSTEGGGAASPDAGSDGSTQNA